MKTRRFFTVILFFFAWSGVSAHQAEGRIYSAQMLFLPLSKPCYPPLTQRLTAKNDEQAILKGSRLMGSEQNMTLFGECTKDPSQGFEDEKVTVTGVILYWVERPNDLASVLCKISKYPISGVSDCVVPRAKDRRP